MAGSSLLALLDDIATVLDDVAILSKVAAKKTAGVLGDDLALNAEQVSGVKAERELPVVWAVAKGSFKNKLILVPSALAISVIAPWLIVPLLMIGGAYLCFEGVEKLAHAFFHKKEKAENKKAVMNALTDPNVDLVEFEQNKIKGAIRTDFILSAEIIVIALGTVAEQSFAMQSAVVSTIALFMTIGVYGLVAGIVKLDDAGLYLLKQKAENTWGKLKQQIGKGILIFAPFLMKLLSIAGTAAMFLVGGGILLHGIPGIDPLLKELSFTLEKIPAIGQVLAAATGLITSFIFGIIAGTIVLGGWQLTKTLIPKKSENNNE